MSNYQVAISGNTTLENFELMIGAEESTGAQFVTSTVSQGGGKPTNVVTFLDLPPGTRPGKPLRFLRGTAPASDNAQPDWAGQLACAGSAITVSAFR
jgi:hypothetical protein